MKRSTLRKVLLGTGFLVILSYQNCGKPTNLEYNGSSSLSSESTYQDVALKILSTSCYQCHNPSNAMGNVSDITNVEYLTFARLITPGHPENSPLMDQVSQGLMPQGGAPLTATEIDILKNWIISLDPSVPQPGGPAPGPSPSPSPSNPSAKYSILASQVFGPRCVACHSSQSYKLNSYSEVMRVVSAGNANNSLLYQAITVGRSGGKMPQGGSLSASDIQAIQDWINAGAPNN